jgi:hypothetical protein
MKKFLVLVTFFAAVCLVANFSALPLQGGNTNDDFDITKDGKVKAGGKEFKNLSEYYKSKYFKDNGKRCGTKKYSPYKKASTAEAALMATPGDCTLSSTTIQGEYWPSQAYTVPIVFHIIHKNDGTGNISDQRVIDQVAVMNEDYRALPGTMGELGFDVKIQFELAGITRTANDKWFRDRGQESYYKTALAWDVTKYMNVYTNSASGYLGYSYYPQDSAGEWWDGIVLLYAACGGRDNGYEPYDQGRTLVHEAGHYFGLAHTFEGCCNDYTCGDLIVDTEMENTAHYYCEQTYTCDTPDPIHNYMNYTDDICMYQFTPEQGNRAVCSLVNYRPGLIEETPPPPADFFVQDISMYLQYQAVFTTAHAVITIKDVDGNVVQDATVYVDWTGVVSDSTSGTTGADGTVDLKSPKTKSTGTFTVTVTNVTHATLIYDSNLNNETSDSI